MHSSGVLVLCLKVVVCCVSNILDLPELKFIRMGLHAFQFNRDNESSSLVMRSGELIGN